MQTTPLARATTGRDFWTLSQVAPFLFVPQTVQDYNRLVAILDALIDVVGEDEGHPLASLMDIVGVVVEHYEAVHVPELDTD